MSGMYDTPSTSQVMLKAYPHFQKQTAATGKLVHTADDHIASLHAGEQRAREMQVQIESIKLLRQDVIACYRKEGVNHYKNCRGVVEKFTTAILDPHMLTPQATGDDVVAKIWKHTRIILKCKKLGPFHLFMLFWEVFEVSFPSSSPVGRLFCTLEAEKTRPLS